MEETKRQILLFGGTTEGRAAAERLLAAGAPCTVCVATEYGREVMKPDPLLTVRVGRMDRAAMADLIRRGAFACVIDATHPHAREVTEEIQGACEETDVPYLRVRRDLTETAIPDPCPQKERLSRSALEENTLSGDAAEENTALTVFAKDADEAAEFLALTQGTVLLTTGSRELERICGIIGDPSRVFARVLPSPESLAACARAGLSGRQIAAMQGPFDFEMNCAMIRHTGASWLLTKETGAAGGYTEKLEAAEACRIRTVVIRAPRQDFQHSDESGRSSVFTEPMSLEQVLTKALTYLERDTKGNPKKNPERSQGGNPEKNPKRNPERNQGGNPERNAAARQSEVMRQSEPVSAEDGLAEGQRETMRQSEPVSAEDGLTARQPEVMRQSEPVSAEDASAEGRRAGDAAPRQSVQQNPAAGHDSAGIASAEAEADSDPDAECARELSLVGIGVGSPLARTQEAEEALARAELIFGAESVLRVLRNDPEKTRVPVYDSARILQYLQEHPQVRKAAVAFSGDSGFYSGAAGMLSLLRKKKQAGEFTDLSVRVICGISSVSWFASRAGIPWQDWKILSSHGRACNVAGEVRRHSRCFLLLSGAEDLCRTGRLLAEAQTQGMLGKLRLIYGYELSRPEEEIRECTPQELCAERTQLKEGLYVLYIAHEDAERTPVLPGLPDSAFLRGKAPMTSSEVRALSLCRLGLTARPVVWDVGAGTGSVSVEAAIACPEGTVWSVEYKKEALDLLYKNRAKFCLSNMEIIEGRAPEILRELPAPTHVFIGGSGGEIGAVIEQALEKNPRARFTANCITAETLAALQEALNRLPVCGVQTVQVSVQRMEELGRYHYLKAQNPVFIISFAGNGTDRGEMK